MVCAALLATVAHRKAHKAECPADEDLQVLGALKLLRLFRRNDRVVAPHVAEHIARDFLDQVGVRDLWREKRDVVPKLGADGFQAPDFEIKKSRALDQAIAGLEPMAAITGMIDEIGGRRQAGKQHEDLP